MGFGETVHIVPLGFEFDRVIKVLEKLRPNRVFLLVTPPDPKYPKEMNDKQQYFNKRVEEKLKQFNIKVKFVEVDIFDMFKVTNAVAKLILEEGGPDGKGSEIYVNMSAAGKLTSIGTTLAVMAIRGTLAAKAERTRLSERTHLPSVYYVFADGYSQGKKEEMEHGLSICNGSETIPLPNFQIETLDERLLRVLAFLAKSNEEEAVTIDDIIAFMIEQKDKRFKDAKSVVANTKPKPNPKEEREIKRITTQENINNLNRGILKKLKENGYIGTKKDGKYSRIWITESGKFAVAMNGLLD